MDQSDKREREREREREKRRKTEDDDDDDDDDKTRLSVGTAFGSRTYQRESDGLKAARDPHPIAGLSRA